MIKPIQGAGYLLRGLPLLIKPGIFPYVIVPVIINALLFALAMILAVAQIGNLIDWILPSLPDWLQWLSSLLWLVFVLASIIVVFFAVALLANIIASPFNSLLAEAVERHLKGQSQQNTAGSLGSALVEMPKAIGNEVIKLAYFAKLAIPLGILFFIPGLNLLAPALWFIFSAWMLALEYCDYHLGSHNLYFAQQRKLLSQEKGLILGFGGASMLATITPVVNFIAMPASVVGATLMLVEKDAIAKLAQQN